MNDELREMILDYIANGPRDPLREIQVTAMIRWSERHWYAGWMQNLPWLIWNATWDDEADRIKELANITGVWMLNAGGDCMPLDEWRRNPVNEDEHE